LAVLGLVDIDVDPERIKDSPDPADVHLERSSRSLRKGQRWIELGTGGAPGRPLNLDQKAALQRGQLWNGFDEAKPPLASRAEQWLFVVGRFH
jgi:hypothetical protein